MAEFEPFPNMTAQERKTWEQIKVNNRAGAERAPMNSGAGSARNLVNQADRAAEGDRDR